MSTNLSVAVIIVMNDKTFKKISKAFALDSTCICLIRSSFFNIYSNFSYNIKRRKGDDKYVKRYRV